MAKRAAGWRAALLAPLVTLAAGAWAGDPAAGRQQAVQCAACHGADGIAILPEAPNLAGQNETYLVKAMKDFKSGARKNEMVSLIAEKLSEKDIADLAAHFHGLELMVHKK